MSSGRLKSSNSTKAYIIAIVVIIVAFLLLGGGSWANGILHRGGLMSHNGHSLNIASWNWATILISMGVGVLIGIFLVKRK